VNQNPEKYSKISVKYDNQIVTTLNNGYKPEEDSLAKKNLKKF
jgi:cell division protein FtsQ